MSDTPDEQLESQLRELTTWPDATPNLWRRALAAAGSRKKEGRSALGRVLGYRPSFRLAVGLAAAAIFIAVGIWMNRPGGIPGRPLRGFGGGESIYGSDSYEWFPRHYYESQSANTIEQTVQESLGAPVVYEQDGDGIGEFARRAGSVHGRGRNLLTVAGQSTPGAFQVPTPEASEAPLPGERHVIRKATVELVTEDVRAAFLKAALLLSEAKGEYVQDSGITGSGEKMQANLTLRVTAERLPEVLNELRQLGEVRSEKTTGEDVTTQVVDLEARLRNEQRVEAELLQLLEKRENSPLKEILELRRTIADVRQTIEQLTAQRERLGRLVSLATVLVIIRPADAPPPEEPGLGTHFLDAMGSAWQKGTMFLVSTLAGLVGIIIGGLIWWILLIVVIVLVRNHLRRRAVTQA